MLGIFFHHRYYIFGYSAVEKYLVALHFARNFYLFFLLVFIVESRLYVSNKQNIMRIGLTKIDLKKKIRTQPKNIFMLIIILLLLSNRWYIKTI